MQKQMKRILSMVVAMALGVAANAANDYAQATFAVRSHDFGYIKEAKGPVSGDLTAAEGAVSRAFEVENIGVKPLIIVSTTTECGCTRPEYPTKPIKPGKKGKVKVTFSPIGRPGAFVKTIKVRTNGKEKTTVLVIKGSVIPKK